LCMLKLDIQCEALRREKAVDAVIDALEVGVIAVCTSDVGVACH